MSGDETGEILARMERLEARMAALEAARVGDMAGIPALVTGILREEMPALIRVTVRDVITQERIVADAQRFRAVVAVGRKVAISVLITAAGTLAVMALQGWI